MTEVEKLRRCLADLYSDMDKSADYDVDMDGCYETMWDYDVEEALIKIQVALFGEELRGRHDDVLDKIKQEFPDV